MDRRLFLGSIIGLALQPTAASAQSQQQPYVPFDPHPDLVYVKMIAVEVSIVSDDPSLLAQFDDNLLGAKVTEFVASRFDVAGHPVICVDRRQLRDLPRA